MKTFTTLSNLYNSLSNNTSSTNTTLGKQLINDQHRYLLQKYFDNERTATTTTVGGATLATTATMATSATSATLTASWTYPTGSQLVNFSNSDQRMVLFTNGSTAISWTPGLSSSATTAITSVGFQAYNIPANISKIKNDTINVGQLKYQPKEIMTRQEWDLVNFLPYTSDIPNYYFIYNNQLNIFPIPSTTGNILTFNYKTRVADLTFSDYTTPGTTATTTAGSTAITLTSGTVSVTMGVPTNVDITYFNLCLRADPPNGDGIWYPIRSIAPDSGGNSTLTLVNPTVNAWTSGGTFTIGQLPILSEDFHDMLVHGALMVYNSSITPDKEKYTQFKALYDTRLELLSEYAGTKSVNVDLGDDPQPVNPNLFLYSNS